jgi:hypothetical protein
LQDHPWVNVLVLEAAEAARNRLAGRATLYAEVWRDPETAETELALLARTSEYDNIFMTQLDAAWEDIFIHALLSPGWLIFSTDFQPPL